MTILIPALALAAVAAGFTLRPRTGCRRCGTDHEHGTRCTYAPCTTCGHRHPLNNCDGRRPLPARWYA